jgi:hypothetical protein
MLWPLQRHLLVGTRRKAVHSSGNRARHVRVGKNRLRVKPSLSQQLFKHGDLRASVAQLRLHLIDRLLDAGLAILPPVVRTLGSKPVAKQPVGHNDMAAVSRQG